MVPIKTRIKLIALLVVLTLLAVLPVQANEKVIVKDQDQIKIVVFKLNDPHYYLEDKDGNVQTVAMDAAPYAKNGRTLVPIRFLGNALGVANDKIGWNQATRTATLLGKKKLELTLGSYYMKSDGSTVKMDVCPEAKNGRTFLLARYVAEGLGFTVDWDQARQIVVCYPAGQEKPDLTKILQEIEKTPVQPNGPAKPYVSQGLLREAYPNDPYVTGCNMYKDMTFMRASLSDLPVQVGASTIYKLSFAGPKPPNPWGRFYVEQYEPDGVEVSLYFIKDGKIEEFSGDMLHDNKSETHWTQEYLISTDTLNTADEVWLSAGFENLVLPNPAKGRM